MIVGLSLGLFFTSVIHSYQQRSRGTTKQTFKCHIGITLSQSRLFLCLSYFSFACVTCVPWNVGYVSLFCCDLSRWTNFGLLSDSFCRTEMCRALKKDIELLSHILVIVKHRHDIIHFTFRETVTHVVHLVGTYKTR